LRKVFQPAEIVKAAMRKIPGRANGSAAAVHGFILPYLMGARFDDTAVVR
jgi:hypothetical protein